MKVVNDIVITSEDKRQLLSSDSFLFAECVSRIALLSLENPSF